MKHITLYFAISLIVTSLLPARVGESRTELERRLLEDRTAIKLQDRELKARLEHPRLAYKRQLEHFPEDVEFEVYFKLAEEEPASRSDLEDAQRNGWELHVVYYKGRSVFEYYQRIGSVMSRFEEEGLLTLLKEDSFWKKVPRSQMEPSAFGYQYEREDGVIRAGRMGQALVVFRPEFDQIVLEGIDEEKAEAEAEAQELAPASVRGF